MTTPVATKITIRFDIGFILLPPVYGLGMGYRLARTVKWCFSGR
jgi:hypothetical protein